ncbi:subtilisin family serine protease [Kibdelosporangium banguiense]|uniref:Subtilisin family serine protease n=1 Tax=Kibdelosporangium banguiense TaxID=1365924 RepID=A0ABS4U2R5_9PSEU|nr:S8 family serine peptidase [Kibdelosporangium banguiense]MBP2330504.1 subtilisin family serine protease [Kibdelosporangium banguiense]
MTRSTQRQVAAALVTTAVLTVIPAGVAVAAPGAQSTPASPAQVTLITGDRVTVRTGGFQVTPAPRGRPMPFQEYTRNGDRYLVPDDAVLLIQSGRLDRELFNITGLVGQGYDDAHTTSIPLLVQGSQALARKAPQGGKVRRELPGLGMTALDQGKTETGSFWRTLGAETLAAGPEKIWLNGKVRATLDQSVPQIGAPTAWQAGFTGNDVQVAVLDSGIDTDHPDLIGKVTQGKDFSGKGSIEDGHGHGTHVASTITGSGAASGGKYKGVAPGANLAVGKVLDDAGEATDDMVLAGMQWASAEIRAKVVNMSLGSRRPSDGTDPMSAAVNTLSRQNGTLFVIAAGNSGGAETIASPGAADDALTVGSVTKKDKLSWFSSRGPRMGDGALKPEIAAPGDGIVAARPAGVHADDPVGDAYQRMSGTSMAAPHVAGAAAILAQQHPDWAGDRLKAALVSSVAPVAESPFAVGAGRVDVARAIRATVVATGSVSTYLPWPNQGAQKRQTVTWHNSGTAPVTLGLQANLTSADGQQAPAGLLGLAANSVTVPAGASASVDVIVTAQDDRPGTYSGILSARTADGVISTRTAISVRQKEQRHNLTVTLLDRNGVAPPVDPERPGIAIINLDTGEVTRLFPGTIDLPKGRYTVHGVIETARAGQEPELSMISHPELVLDKDVTQVLDARAGKLVSAEPDNPAADGGTHTMSAFSKVRSCSCTFGYLVEINPRLYPMFAATVPGTASDAYAFGQHRRATEQVLELSANDGQPFQVKTEWYQASLTAENLTLPVVHGGAGTVEDIARIDARGKLVLVDIPRTISYEDMVQRTKNIKDAGGKLVMVNFFDEAPGTSVLGGGPIEPLALPMLYSFKSVTADRFEAYVKKGNAAAKYVNRPFPNFRYELAYGVERQLSTPQVHKPKDRELIPVRTSYHDNVPGEVRYWAAMDFFGNSLYSQYTQPAAGQQERIEYFTPGKWAVSWSTAMRGPSYDDQLDLLQGKSYRIGWNKAVVGPSFRGLTRTNVAEQPRPWVMRKDGEINGWLPLWGDSAGRARRVDEFPGPDISGEFSLYRNGNLLKSVPVADPAFIPVPDEAADYRLTGEVNRKGDPNWPLSTSISGDWRFRSSSADEGKALPLLNVRYDPAVDLRNRAPGGKAFSFPVSVERQGGTPCVAKFTVDVSYDDGATWQPAHVWHIGNSWNVGVKHPASGFASLRANVTDTDGNSVQQTVIRAYQIGS